MGDFFMCFKKELKQEFVLDFVDNSPFIKKELTKTKLKELTSYLQDLHNHFLLDDLCETPDVQMFDWDGFDQNGLSLWI